MRIVVPARPNQLAWLRAELRAWLRHLDTGARLSLEAELALLLAVSEAASNAIEHAYRGREPGIVELAVMVEDDAVRAEVVDHGRWRPPPADPGARGRGLLLMSECTQMCLSRGSRGTRVVLRASRAA